MTRNNCFIRYGYIISLGFLAVTGFAQMPIFKRYYIADIPGLGWLARFYVTHAMHYIFATLFIALAAYAAIDYLLGRRDAGQITPDGYTKLVMLALLTISGGLLVYKNFTGTPFSPTMISLLDLLHLGLCMILLLFSGYTAFRKKRWVTTRSSDKRISTNQTL